MVGWIKQLLQLLTNKFCSGLTETRSGDSPPDREPPRDLPTHLSGRVAAALLVVAAGAEVPVADWHLHLLTVGGGGPGLGTDCLGTVLRLGAHRPAIAAAVRLAGGGGAGGLADHLALLHVPHLVLHVLHHPHLRHGNPPTHLLALRDGGAVPPGDLLRHHALLGLVLTLAHHLALGPGLRVVLVQHLVLPRDVHGHRGGLHVTHGPLPLEALSLAGGLTDLHRDGLRQARGEGR